MHVRSLYIDDAGLTLCSGSGDGDMKVTSKDDESCDVGTGIAAAYLRCLMCKFVDMACCIGLELGNVRAAVFVRKLASEE